MNGISRRICQCGRGRAPGVPARLARPAHARPRLRPRQRPRTAARGAPGQGPAYWELHEVVHARQHGWPTPVFEVTQQAAVLAKPHTSPRPCEPRSADSRRARTSAWPSPRTTCVRSRTRSRSTGSRAARAATSSFRCSGGWATTSSDRAGGSRPARADLLPGRRPGRRHGLPGPPAAREHDAPSRFCTSRFAARRSTNCSPRRRRAESEGEMDLVAYVRVSKVGDRDGDPFGARTSSGEPIRRTLRRTLRRTTTAQRVPPRALIVAARHSVGGHTNPTTNAFQRPSESSLPSARGPRRASESRRV